MANNITVSVLAETRQARRGLDEIKGQLSGFSKLTKGVGAAVGAAFLFDKARQGLGWLKGKFDEVVDAGSNLQQSTGAVDAVFGKSASSIKQLGTNAAQAFGLSRNEFQELASTMGAGFKNSGIKDFAGATTDVIGLGADLSAQFGGSTKEAVQAIGSLMRGEADPIERYGVAIKESAISAELAARGQDKLKGSALAQAQAQARLSLLFKQTKDAQGAFNRESGSLAGVQQRNAAAIENTKAKIGSALLPVMTQFQTFVASKVLPIVEQAATWFAANLPNAIDTLKAKFAEVKAALAPVGAAFQTVFQFIKDNPETVKAFALTLGILAAAVGVVTAVQWAWNAAMAANPIGLIIVGIAALVAGIVYAWKNCETFRTVVLAVWGAIKTASVAVWGFLSKTVPAAVVAIKNAIVGAWNRIKAITAAVWNKIKSDISTVWNAIKSTNQRVINTIRNLISGAWNKIKSVTSGVWNKIKSDISTVWNAIKSTNQRVINTIRNVITGAWNRIRSITSAVWNGIRSVVSNVIGAVVSTVRSKVTAAKDAAVGAWSALRERTSAAFQALVEIVRGRIDTLVSNVRGIRSKIIGVFAGAASWLWNAGQNIIRGLINGIQAMIGTVRDKLATLTNLIPSWKGPASKDARLLYGAGQLIIGGLVRAFDDGKTAVRRQLGKVTGDIQAAFRDVMDPKLTPTVSVKAAAAGAGGWGSAGGGVAGRTYQITVVASPDKSPAQVGRELVEFIRDFENTTGRTVLAS